jgi:uncharacterized protein YggE
MKTVLSALGLSCALLVTGGAIASFMASPAIAQSAITREPIMNLLTVTGQGTEPVTTTRAQVSIGVEVNRATAAEAQQEAAQRSTAVIELLQSRQVQKLETTGIRLNPQYTYTDNQRQLVGYTATNLVSFEMPIDAVGTLLDDAVEVGATRIQGINFVADDAAIAAARETALAAAVADARSQADVVLRTLGFTAEEIVSIQINGANLPRPVPLPRQALLSDTANEAATPVVGGEQTVSASVTLQIRY